MFMMRTLKQTRYIRDDVAVRDGQEGACRMRPRCVGHGHIREVRIHLAADLSSPIPWHVRGFNCRHSSYNSAYSPIQTTVAHRHTLPPTVRKPDQLPQARHPVHARLVNKLCLVDAHAHRRVLPTGNGDNCQA
jgi:hypothetical protein